MYANVNTVIDIDEADIEANTNMTTGKHVGKVIVHHDDGAESTFNLFLRINKQGRAVAEIATNSKDGDRSTHKSVTAVKR